MFSLTGYEEFVSEPEGGLAALCRFLGVEVPRTRLERAVAEVSDRSVGKGSGELTPEVRRQVSLLAEPGRSAIGRFGPTPVQ